MKEAFDDEVLENITSLDLLRILKPARLGFTSWCKSHRAKYCAKHCHLFVIVLIFQPASFSYRVYLLSSFVFCRITETNVPNQFIVSLVRLRLLPHYRWVQKFFLCHVCTFAGFKFCWIQVDGCSEIVNIEFLLDSTFAGFNVCFQYSLHCSSLQSSPTFHLSNCLPCFRDIRRLVFGLHLVKLFSLVKPEGESQNQQVIYLAKNSSNWKNLFYKQLRPASHHFPHQHLS